MYNHSPAHLLRQGQTFYFRMVIPKRFQKHFGQTEIRYSLRTGYKREATPMATRLSAAVYELCSELEHIPYPTPDVTERVRQRITTQRNAVMNGDAPPAQIRLQQPQTSHPEADTLTYKAPATPTAITSLTEAIDKYFADKTATWKRKKTALDVRPILSEFVEILGDIPTSCLDRDSMRVYRDTVRILPVRRSIMPQYRGKTIGQLKTMNIPKEQRLGERSVSNRFTHMRVFLNWAEDEGLIAQAKPLNKVLKSHITKANGSPRQPFSMSDLRKLFHNDAYRKGRHRKASQFWIPLLGLLTGARLEELCQLHLSDIRQIDGTWCIDINDEDDKITKTNAGRRIVPIHQALIDLGIMERKEHLEAIGHTRLFPKIKRRKATDKYAGAVEQWFTKYRRSCGVGGLAGEYSPLVFHSFRHFVISYCKLNDIDRRKVKELVGHEQGLTDDVTQTYETAYPAAILLHDVVSKFHFAEELKLPKLRSKKHIRME